jgi:hypothetical protein
VSPICPSGRSLYIEIVTFGDVAFSSVLSWAAMSWRSFGEEVLMSVIPLRSNTIAMAVCQSSMIAVLPLYCGSHRAP